MAKLLETTTPTTQRKRREMSELKTCPLCGGVACLSVLYQGELHQEVEIECAKCGLNYTERGTKQEIADHWNTRTK